MKLSAIVLLAAIELATGLTLDCNFQRYTSVYTTIYTCVTKDLYTSYKNRTIAEVSGSHLSGMRNNDVGKVFVRHQNCAFLPLNLGKFFTNLKILYVMKSNLQQLIDGDLDGLDALEIFDVSYNPVEFISRNFFKNHRSIKVISFYDCHIKKIETGALDWLLNIERMHFDGNVCVDQRFETDSNSLEEINEQIYDQCHGNDHTLRSNQSESCHIATSAESKEEFVKSKGEITASESSDSVSLVLIILLALTTFGNVIFAFALYRVYKSNFNSSWNEMRNVLA